MCRWTDEEFEKAKDRLISFYYDLTVHPLIEKFKYINSDVIYGEALSAQIREPYIIYIMRNEQCTLEIERDICTRWAAQRPFKDNFQPSTATDIHLDAFFRLLKTNRISLDEYLFHPREYTRSCAVKVINE